MKKFFALQIALFLLGSAFFLGGWTFGKVKKGVVVDGVAVGGLSYAAAETAVREKLASVLPPFVVHTEEGDEFFETGFQDDLYDLLRRAGKGEELKAKVRRVWVNAEEELGLLCARLSFGATDARLSFSARGFAYQKETLGRACDYQGLLKDVEGALKEGRDEVTLRTFPVAAKVTEKALRARTRLLGSYTTYFDGGNAPRAHNISLAVSKISGVILSPHGEFSFNDTVGKRTAENGFEQANIIAGGQFVPGIGGGVCQVSTTLMNAALLSGLKVTESHPHSLSVGYVPPSRDAMVSDYADLKFVNPYDEPVYLLGLTGGGRVKFTFYGLPDGKTYDLESKILLVADPPAEQIVEGDEDKLLRAPKQGIASESYLLVYRDGTLLSRTLLRRDAYAVVQGIRQVKREENSPADEGAPQEAPSP